MARTTITSWRVKDSNNRTLFVYLGTCNENDSLLTNWSANDPGYYVSDVRLSRDEINAQKKKVSTFSEEIYKICFRHMAEEFDVFNPDNADEYKKYYNYTEHIITNSLEERVKTLEVKIASGTIPGGTDEPDDPIINPGDNSGDIGESGDDVVIEDAVLVKTDVRPLLLSNYNKDMDKVSIEGNLGTSMEISGDSADLYDDGTLEVVIEAYYGETLKLSVSRNDVETILSSSYIVDENSASTEYDMNALNKKMRFGTIEGSHDFEYSNGVASAWYGQGGTYTFNAKFDGDTVPDDVEMIYSSYWVRCENITRNPSPKWSMMTFSYDTNRTSFERECDIILRAPGYDDFKITVKQSVDPELSTKYEVIKYTTVSGNALTLSGTEFSEEVASNEYVDGVGILNIGYNVYGFEINGNAFKDNSDIKSFTIEGKCKKIGNDAFRNCGNLESFICYEAGEIGEYCFNNCQNLVNVNIKNTKEFVGSGINGKEVSKLIIHDYAFYEMTDKPCVIDINRATEIGKKAFSRLPNSTFVDTLEQNRNFIYHSSNEYNTWVLSSIGGCGDPHHTLMGSSALGTDIFDNVMDKFSDTYVLYEGNRILESEVFKDIPNLENIIFGTCPIYSDLYPYEGYNWPCVTKMKPYVFASEGIKNIRFKLTTPIELIPTDDVTDTTGKWLEAPDEKYDFHRNGVTLWVPGDAVETYKAAWPYYEDLIKSNDVSVIEMFDEFKKEGINRKQNGDNMKGLMKKSDIPQYLNYKEMTEYFDETSRGVWCFTDRVESDEHQIEIDGKSWTFSKNSSYVNNTFKLTNTDEYHAGYVVTPPLVSLVGDNTSTNAIITIYGRVEVYVEGDGYVSSQKLTKSGENQTLKIKGFNVNTKLRFTTFSRGYDSYEFILVDISNGCDSFGALNVRGYQYFVESDITYFNIGEKFLKSGSVSSGCPTTIIAEPPACVSRDCYLYTPNTSNEDKTDWVMFDNGGPTVYITHLAPGKHLEHSIEGSKTAKRYIYIKDVWNGLYGECFGFTGNYKQ